MPIRSANVRFGVVVVSFMIVGVGLILQQCFVFCLFTVELRLLLFRRLGSLKFSVIHGRGGLCSVRSFCIFLHASWSTLFQESPGLVAGGFRFSARQTHTLLFTHPLFEVSNSLPQTGYLNTQSIGIFAGRAVRGFVGHA